MRRLIKSAACSVMLTVLFMVSSLTSVYSQTSNKGTDFWVAYAGHIDGTTSRMTIFLSSDVNTTYKVEANGSVISSGTVQANIVTPVFINPSQHNVYVGSSEQKEINKGIHVTSGSNISVYCVISNNARTAGSMILPSRALGNTYYAFSYKNEGTTIAQSQFTIVGVEDNTDIEIVSTATSRSGTLGNGINKINISLNKGDVYQYQAPADISGSLIRTLGNCKPIAVFSGGTWVAFCEEGNPITNPGQSLPNRPAPSGGDNLYQQLFPVSAWGKNYVTAPFYNTENGNVDVVRIIVAEDATTLNITGGADLIFLKPHTNPYKKGDIITYYTRTPSVIKSDKPIGVAQYQSAQNCNPINRPNVNLPGDPEMTILNPVEQTLTDITVFSKLNSVPGVNTAINQYYLNIILKTADAPGLKLDGSAVSNFKAINSEYSYAVVNVTGSQDQHRINAPGGFTAIAYGYGNFESYAYLAGADVKNLYQNITAAKPGNILVSTGCTGQPVKFILRLPYITSSIVWDLGDGQSPYTDNAPKYTPELVDGKTVYVYEYPLTPPLYPAAGKYEVTAISQNPAPGGCDAQEIVKIEFEVIDPPIARFSTLAATCVGAEVVFTDESTGSGRAISSWLWDFGDGTTSTSQNPKHTFTYNGTFTVKLVIQGETGCVVEYTSDIQVSQLPVAAFSFSQPNCSSQAIIFTDQSTSADGKIVKWMWDPGDGSGIKEFQNAGPFVHTYLNSGVFTASLSVQTERSCTSVRTEKKITVNSSPVVDFTIPEICLRDAMANFTDKTTMPDGSTPASYLWNFGDQNSTAANNVSTLRNPGHVYTQAGDYQVSLTVVSQAGCSVNLTQKLTVNGSDPVAGFSVRNPSGLCSNSEVVFKNESTVSFGSIGKVEWYFDYDNDKTISLTDNEPEPGEEYSFQYPMFYSPASKTFRVRMVAYSGGVCSDEFFMTITVMAAPKTAFSALPNVCENGASFQITQASEIHGQQGQGSFSGPGITSSGVFDPSLAGVGTHEILYLFTASNGCEDSAIQHIEVMPVPSASAGKDTVILSGGQTELKGTGAGSNVIYKWSPSIGLDRDDVPNPIANPTESITYTLTITSDQGCSTSDEVFVKVLQLPEVPTAFTPNADGVNDVWNIKYLESYSGAKIKVYGRNGSLVYESLGYSSAWDGTRQGNDLPVGTYYYIIEPGSGRSRISGSVTIIR